MCIKCPKCQAENPDSQKFCGECGTFLPQPDSAIHTMTIETPTQEFTTGSVFARRYHIIEELGKGGMGKVFRVLDKKLSEEIALKIIKPEIASDKKTIERFKNELRLARKIRHKRIGSMYELLEENGIHYITMEYVSGGDLKRFIRRAKRLTIGAAISIAIQVCEGLTEAHSHGVIHRDLKPNNIMIDEDGNARIMDFGIARSIKAKGSTGPGVMIGTPEYMSPEQADAKEIDQRSDIYSLGVILYEMTTGHLPFEGDTPLSIAVKHKTEAPKDPRELNPQIPNDLRCIILKCMQKDKENRFQSTEELLVELENIERGIPTTDRKIPKRKTITSKEITVTFGVKKLIPIFAVMAFVIAAISIWLVLQKKKIAPVPKIENSIAVISFENQTGEESYDYLQKAIPNLLITSLENTGYLYVATWERMFDLLKQMGKKDVQIIDRDLGFELCRLEGIQAIVIGSFIKMGDTFATDVKVLDVETKKLLKSTSSQGDGIDSILKTQINKLTVEVSQVVGIPKGKSGAHQTRIADVTTSSMEAYTYFLKGKEAYEKFYFTDAIQHLKKALELDPQFSAAYLYLGLAFGEQGDRDAKIEAYIHAKTFSEQATEKEKLYIDAEYAYSVESDFEKAFQILKQLAADYPKEKQVYFELGNYYQNRDMYQDAVTEYLKALELDPNWAYLINALAYVYSDVGEYEKAIEYFQKYSDLSPGDANPIDSMAEQYFRMGQLDTAIAKYQQALEIKPDFDAGLRMAFVLAFMEDYTQALECLERFVARTDSLGRKAEGLLWMGVFNFYTGKRKKAFNNLKSAEEFADRIRTGSLNYVRGWMFYELGQMQLCKENIQKMWDIVRSFFPDSPSWQAFYFCDLGLIAVRQGNIEEARSRLKDMRDLMPKITSPRDINSRKLDYDWLQAEVFMAEGSPEKAIEVLENTVTEPAPNLQTDTYGPYNLPYRQDFLARAYYQAGKLDKAITEYERLIEFIPGQKDWHLTHPIYHFLLAKLYEEKGHASKAVNQHEQYLGLMQDCDPGIAEVEEAKKRLARLRGF